MFRLIFKVFRAPPLNPFIVIPFFNSSILKMSIKSVRRLNSFNPKRLIKKREVKIIKLNDKLVEAAKNLLTKSKNYSRKKKLIEDKVNHVKNKIAKCS